MRGKPLRDDEKEAIRRLRERGLTIREISQELSLSKDAVHRACSDIEVPLTTKRSQEPQAVSSKLRRSMAGKSFKYRGSPLVYANAPYPYRAQAQEEEIDEEGPSIEPQGINERKARQDEVNSWVKQEYERLRIESEAREAAIAEERARREQEEKVSNARRQFFNKLNEAHKAGKIDFNQLLLLRSDRHSLGDIERGEKVLKDLVRNVRIQSEAREAALAEEQARREREEKAREAAMAEERARREREERVSNARQQFFKKAKDAYRAGRIDYGELVILRMDRDTLEDIERGEKVLKLLAGNPSTGVPEKRVV